MTYYRSGDVLVCEQLEVEVQDIDENGLYQVKVTTPAGTIVTMITESILHLFTLKELQ